MRTRALPWISLAMAALMLAGCTSAKAQPGNTPNSAALANQQYTACLRDHGVAQPGPSAPQPTTDPDVMQAAQAACQQLAPAPPTESTDDLVARRATAQCMRDSGYADWPDPVPGSATIALPRDIDGNSAAVKSALNICARKAFNTPSPSPTSP